MNNLQQKINNSNFSITKKFFAFIIVPILILIAGIVLMFTTGFNLGPDYANGITFKVYTNNDGGIEDAQVYDINKAEDYNAVYEKIETVLSENGLKIKVFRKTTMNIYDYDVYGGQAVEVAYQGSSETKDEIRTLVLQEFDYQTNDKAVSSFDNLVSKYSFDYVLGLVAAVIFALVVASIYMSMRFKNNSAILIALLQVALDIFLTLSLIMITRIEVNTTIAIVIISSLMFALINVLLTLISVKNGEKKGQFEKMKNYEIANTVAKQNAVARALVYSIVLVALIIVASATVTGVSNVALGLIISLVVSYYTSQFILPSIWATFTSSKKKKKLYKKEEKDMLN